MSGDTGSEMPLRPFANLFCVYEPDPDRLATYERTLAASGEFELVRPADAWLVGVAPLPDGPPEPPDVRMAGLFFCEGADRVLDGHATRTPGAVAELALDHPERLASLPGDFTFIACRADGALTAVRSGAGLVPLYLWRDRASLVIATRMDYFVRFLDEPPALDPLVNATWMTGYCLLPDRRTFLEGIGLVDRGHFLQVRNGRIMAQDQYWDPRPQSGARLQPDPERPAQLRELLIQALARDLSPAGGNLLSLSGGVDSSALGALAVGRLGMPLSAFTFLPPDPEDRARDEGYVDALASRFPFVPHWRVVVDTPKHIELILRPHVACVQMAHATLASLAELKSQAQVSVLVSGEYADEAVGCFAQMPDWINHTSLWRLLRDGRASWPHSSGRDLVWWAKRRSRSMLGQVVFPFPSELPTLVTPQVRHEYSEWVSRQRRAAAQDKRPWRHTQLLLADAPFALMNWEATSPLGIRRSLPFFTREMLELSFACHPSEKIGPGTKKLLRNGLRDDVPALNLQRPDKAIDASVDHPLEWVLATDEQLVRIVREDWFPYPPSQVDAEDAQYLASLTHIAHSRAAALASRAELREAKDHAQALDTPSAYGLGSAPKL